jgi:hypothetical protein
MRWVMVSTCPTEHYGVAGYALQSARAIRGDGHTLGMVAWGLGHGDHHLRVPPPVGPNVLKIAPCCAVAAYALSRARVGPWRPEPTVWHR